ncbi:MAG: hypothetical protein AVDCRST_MAG30-859 [uncultured Solirubrobacteraceae bacterium]|uniref:Uncharacterized protein n=1 Tax=uncultured Solirubrobacteraceae bacterium TaxID=1162706 RepID=A0A6J4RVE2_9ACTN|nr:MAG: hypothetical protein AVDCRST_MAG30-859 [uncultured Solirubrobacteraceae bacterium]
MDLKKALIPVAVLILAAALVALVAGVAYGVMALLVGLVIVGGLAAGYGVSKADEAPFAHDGGETPLGDTPEHSDVSSAVTHPPT